MAIGIETERKLIIKLPDISLLAREDGYRKSEIVQTYFSSGDGVTHRVRKRVYEGETVYTETKKTRISKMSVIEDERTISEEEYLALLENHQIFGTPLHKSRHIFSYGGYTVEVDVYPQWTRTCILEVEVESEEVSLTLPPYIEVLRDVSGMKAYSNHTMSFAFPEEII